MARRGAGEGSIGKRSDGRWRVRLTTPDGTRHEFYAKTKAQAVERLCVERERLSDGLVAPGRLSVAQYLTDWLESISGDLKPSTGGALQARRHQAPHPRPRPAAARQVDRCTR